MATTTRKISIVTPSFNQAQYLEQTICSILDQGYPNLEYIVIDGGSKDDSVGVIKKYERHLKYWVSERDRGQAHALNKGFEHATGEIHAYINSDDFLEPGALARVAEEFAGGKRWVAGDVRTVQAGQPDGVIHPQAETSLLVWFSTNPIPQPGCFWEGALTKAAGPVREDLRYVFDYDLWLRFRLRQDVRLHIMDQTLASYRLHDASKTMSQWLLFDKEFWQVRHDYRDVLNFRDRFANILDERRWQADELQREALDLAGRKTPQALAAIARSLVAWPPIMFQRRTPGALRRVLLRQANAPAA